MLNGANKRLRIATAATNRIRKKRTVSHQPSFFFLSSTGLGGEGERRLSWRGALTAPAAAAGGAGTAGSSGASSGGVSLCMLGLSLGRRARSSAPPFPPPDFRGRGPREARWRGDLLKF